ncbi:MAG TPA: protein-L-isoaspartate(D-aspartate) O-methyltransferase [Gemmatimonadales bacterium]|jgi:protein-L-isoaspartate(D-aspartate) O-methyltransferase|nr:protein-L-isoaspartate(D-aspartate) O-methyltransferase [Gemmatimonadales bacterium]
MTGRDTYGGYRARLVESLRAKGIRDLAVLRAFAVTSRHLFVPEALRHRAYEDTALPIGTGQTISQPFTQARYLEALGLRGTERVLEIGTGSGYQTALLAALADQVFTIERVRSLAETAQAALKAAGVGNVSLLVGDGTLGWSAYAPFDAILVAAGGPEVPPPLVEQLRTGGAGGEGGEGGGGRMIIPLGAKGAQTLTLVRRTDAGVSSTPLGDARFVPLVGEHGFDA